MGTEFFSRATNYDNVEGGTLPMKAKIKKRGDSAADISAQYGDEDEEVGITCGRDVESWSWRFRGL